MLHGVRCEFCFVYVTDAEGWRFQRTLHQNPILSKLIQARGRGILNNCAARAAGGSRAAYKHSLENRETKRRDLYEEEKRIAHYLNTSESFLWRSGLSLAHSHVNK